MKRPTATVRRQIGREMARIEVSMMLGTYSYPKGVPKGTFNEETGFWEPNLSELRRACGYHEDTKSALEFRQTDEYGQFRLQELVRRRVAMDHTLQDQLPIIDQVVEGLYAEFAVRILTDPGSFSSDAIVRYLPTYLKLQAVAKGTPPPGKEPKDANPKGNVTNIYGDVYADLPEETKSRVAEHRKRISAQRDALLAPVEVVSDGTDGS